jgi:hypothetical protein
LGIPRGGIGQFSLLRSVVDVQRGRIDLLTLDVKGDQWMKAGILFTGTGPILILTSYQNLDDPKLVEKLSAKGIRKFMASEVSVDKVKKLYGNHFNVIMGDLQQTDDLRVLDYNGHNVFYNFKFSELGKMLYHETSEEQP